MVYQLSVAIWHNTSDTWPNGHDKARTNSSIRPLYIRTEDITVACVEHLEFVTYLNPFVIVHISLWMLVKTVYLGEIETRLLSGMN